MNIEGSEREAINSIDWDDFEKPCFFKIAMHSNEIRREVSPILRENGYSQIAETEFYSEQEYTTFYHGLANPEPTSS